MPSRHAVQLPVGHGYPHGLADATRGLLVAYFRDFLDDSGPGVADRAMGLLADEQQCVQAHLMTHAAGALALAAYTHAGHVVGPIPALALSDVTQRAQAYLAGTDVSRLADALMRVTRGPDSDHILYLTGSAMPTVIALCVLTSQGLFASAAVHTHAPAVRPSVKGVPSGIRRLAVGLLAELDQALAGSPTPSAVVTLPDTSDDSADLVRRSVDFIAGAVTATGVVLVPLPPSAQIPGVAFGSGGLPGLLFPAHQEPDVAELHQLLVRGEASDADCVARWDILGPTEEPLVRLHVRWFSPVKAEIKLLLPGEKLVPTFLDALATSDAIMLVPWSGDAPTARTPPEEFLRRGLLVQVERLDPARLSRRP